MKTLQIARGIAGVLSLVGVMGLVACSAETGAPEGQIGEQSQNLGNAAPSVTTTGITQLTSLDTDPAANTQTLDMFHSASCKIFNVDHYDFVLAGGFKAAGGALDTIVVYNPVANTWTWLGASSGPKLHVARGDLQGIPVADDNTRCAFVGGSTSEGGVASKAVDILHVDNTGAYAIANGTDLNTARSNFALSTCGNQLIAFGGQDNGTHLASVEYSSNDVAAAAWTTTNALTTARYDFAFAKKPGEDKYFVAGGHVASGVTTKLIEQITASSCVTTVNQLANTAGTRLSASVEGPVAFYQGTTDTFFVAGGRDSTPAAVTNVDKVTVDWGTPSNTAVAADTALNTAVYRPMLVQSYSGTNPAYMLIGGTDGQTGASTDSVAKVQQYQKLYGWHTATPVSRYLGGAQEIDGVVYVAAGMSISGGTKTALTSVEAITP